MSDGLHLFPRTKAHYACDMEPGEWKPAIDASNGKRSASIVCPLCKQRSWLDHAIADDGTVSPSIVCPTEGCTFHVAGRLLSWDPP